MEKILVTGARGMLGSYIMEQFREHDIKTLGLHNDSDYVCDLRKSSPDFSDDHFDTVIHAAGTEEESKAFPLNLEGTLNLIKGFGKNVPTNFVYISSYRVYSQDAGENITEEANLWADGNIGKSKANAEQELRKWALDNNITLTIIRPARMFGNGVAGETLRLFNDAVKGYYIHIRGNDAKVSVVTAYDVARGIKKIYEGGGVYNAADGTNPRFIEMVESMSANAGAKKRMTHLPAAWAEWLWRLAGRIPFINRNLSPAIVGERMKTLTLDGSRFADRAGISYHDTLAVMEHLDTDYPYSFDQKIKHQSVYEA